jgi:hypothetical protein
MSIASLHTHTLCQDPESKRREHNFKDLILLSQYSNRVQFRFPAGARDFLLLHNVRTGFGTHPALYIIGFSGVKAAGA